MSTPFHCGYCSLAGRPNAGKSTLLNRLCGQKLAIVTDKPQTTRDKILGIKTTDEAQMIFLDTPGLHQSDKALNKRMMREAENAIKDSDIILFLNDPTAHREDEDLDWIKDLKRYQKEIIVVVNKVDKVVKEELLPIIKRFSKSGVKTIIPISAATGEGVEHLEEEIIKRLPISPPFFPADTLTEQTERFLTAEIIREKLFKFTRQEIPYSSTVAIEDFKERNEKLNAVYAVIYVEKESQKSIVIGKGGEMIKRIGRTAREDLEESFGKKFYLDLQVKCKKDWTKDEKFIKSLDNQ